MKHRIAAARERAPLLVSTTALMAAVLAVSLAGLLLDPRVITGVPAWLKPAKFSASVAIYCATLAWILTVLPAERGLRRTGHLIGGLLILEVALILVQVGRGTTSHFNVATAFDGAVFSLMGTMISVVMLATMYVLWRAFRVTIGDRGLLAAIRWGLAITIVGGWLGFSMTRATREQQAARARGEVVAFNGAHTVGAPDGGPGIPLVKWSATSGDLRVAHFFGLHGMQLMPLALFAMRRRRRPPAPGAERRALALLGLAWFALVAATLAQALAGRPFIPYAGS